MLSSTVISGKSGIVWPALPTLGSAQVLSLLFQLQQTEYWAPERLEAQQFSQLRVLLEHARRTVPFYRKRLEAAGFEAGYDLDKAVWRRIPPLTRAEVQSVGEDLYSTAPPRDHGKVKTTSSSGSTGRPVTIQVTQLLNIIQAALVLRNDRWQKLDITGKKAIIRSYPDARMSYPDGLHAKGWGNYIDKLFPTGAVALLHVATSVADQAEWLGRVNPDYLATYPTNLMQLTGYCIDNDVKLPRLKSIATISEALPDGIHALVRKAWNIPLFDIYSAQEVGAIASQCPDTANYHVAAESVYVEILDDADRPCAPGQTGRVVVTPLHNFATPLVRYDIGDYAEVGDVCPCGRGLPVLKRIIGRTRNMMTGPDGQRFRPSLGSRGIASLAPVLQFQLVQRQIDHVELRLVTARALSPPEEAAISRLVESRIGYPLTVTLSYHAEIQRGVGGKFEDFVSEVSN